MLSDLNNISRTWGSEIAQVRHDLHKNDLFSLDALAELIRENPDCVSETATMNKGSEDRVTFIFDYLPPRQAA